MHRDGINTDFVGMFMLYLLLNCCSLYLIVLVLVVSFSVLLLFSVSDCSSFSGFILCFVAVQCI